MPRPCALSVLVKTVLGSYVGAGAPILIGILVVGLVDVHWEYDLDFDPWPNC